MNWTPFSPLRILLALAYVPLAAYGLWLAAVHELPDVFARHPLLPLDTGMVNLVMPLAAATLLATPLRLAGFPFFSLERRKSMAAMWLLLVCVAMVPPLHGGRPGRTVTDFLLHMGYTPCSTAGIFTRDAHGNQMELPPGIVLLGWGTSACPAGPAR